MIFFFSGCITSQPSYYSTYSPNQCLTKDDYIIKTDTYYIGDDEEIDYQEMYFEGFGEEQEDLEYE